jgi:hypothetical protein
MWTARDQRLMDLAKLATLDLYKLVPPAVAIIVLLASPITSAAVKDLMTRYVDSEPLLATFKTKLVEVASDGATRVSFIGATISALATLASQFLNAHELVWWGALVFVVSLIFTLTLVWALTRTPGALVDGAQRYLFVYMTRAQLCRLLLLAWNLLLIFIIVILAIQ